MLQADTLQHPFVDYYYSVLFPFNSTNLFNYKIHIIVSINGEMERILVL